MHDEVISSFMNKTLFDEVIPTLTLSKEDCEQFAASVIDRFKNPFIDHQLLSISLNSTSKWKARVMPSLLGYVKKYNKLPECITASFAFYIKFYQGQELTEKGLVAHREDKEEYIVSDDRAVLEFYLAHKDDSVEEIVKAVASNIDFWGQDLTLIKGFEQAVVKYLNDINSKGAYAVMKECL